MKEPLVSIIVPCYNQAGVLSETLRSVCEQTSQQWECVVVNDGSPDSVGDVARKWMERDPRFIYLESPENKGVSSARNKGIAAAKGEYILPLDGDDKISANYLEGCLEVFRKDPQTRLVYGKASFFGAKKGIWDLPTYDYTLMLSRNIIYCTAMFRKTDWQSCGGYDEQFKHGLEDWDFWLSMLNEKDKVVRHDGIMFWYRIKDSSRNSAMLADQQKTFDSQNAIYEKHKDKISAIIPSPLQLYIDHQSLKHDLEQYKNRWELLKKNPMRFLAGMLAGGRKKEPTKNEL